MISWFLSMGLTLSVNPLLFNLFSPQSLPDGSGFFFTQHFLNVPLCADHRPKVKIVTVSGLHSAFGRGFLMQANGKLSHSQLVGIEIC